MPAQSRKKPPVVRLPPKSNLELVLTRGAQIAIIFIALLAVIFILQAGRFLLAPFALAIVVGLMMGPVANKLESWRLPPTVSAAISVLLFIFIIIVVGAAVVAPLASWSERIPQLWGELQLKLSSLREPLETVRNLQKELQSVTGASEGMTVNVDEETAVESVAVLAPTLLAQLLIFLASLYFFVATRHQTRAAILTIFIDRRLRWRAAHIFREVEDLVSGYLLAITLINIGLAIAVGLGLLMIGVPSALLWGALAGILNFVIYIGPAIMAVILFGVGLMSFDTFAGAFLPPLVYLTINAIEAQFVTPTVIGRQMTMNPFLVFLAVAFWLWLWGPVGGFIAIPALLIFIAIARNLMPGINWGLPPESER
ncbi:AI-2E family transporter [Nitratireductor basaltis]|nr:AI-2E family transporter [Nitratireductor basaltis]